MRQWMAALFPEIGHGIDLFWCDVDQEVIGRVLRQLRLPVIEQGTAADQRRRLHLDAEGIVAQVIGLVSPNGEGSADGAEAHREIAATA